MAQKKNSVLTEETVRKIVKEEIRPLEKKVSGLGEKVSVLPTIQEIEKMVSHLPTKEHFDERMDMVSKLPTKEYFDMRMDMLSKEIQDARDELTIHQGKHDETDERLDRLENHAGLEPL